DLGMYIGITGWVCDERRGYALRDIVNYIPHDRLLIETDAPYLLPRTLRPKPKSRRNEPKHLTEVLSVLAACRNEETGWLGLTTSTNARSLFQLDVKRQ
ncbi:MAG: TatD family hydrolase, partial [Pseudomonadota bacterium]|nr:TatD family hydrolase [Pseudomonadota bacterium]